MKTKFGNFETETQAGAMRLCEMIRAYWASQGKAVKVWPYLRAQGGEGKLWSIQSNIVINRFDAPIPAAVQRTTPLDNGKSPKKPEREAA